MRNGYVTKIDQKKRLIRIVKDNMCLAGETYKMWHESLQDAGGIKTGEIACMKKEKICVTGTNHYYINLVLFNV